MFALNLLSLNFKLSGGYNRTPRSQISSISVNNDDAAGSMKLSAAVSFSFHSSLQVPSTAESKRAHLHKLAQQAPPPSAHLLLLLVTAPPEDEEMLSVTVTHNLTSFLSVCVCAFICLLSFSFFFVFVFLFCHFLSFSFSVSFLSLSFSFLPSVCLHC